MHFALKKYKLVYFSCSRKNKFNLKVKIQLDKTERTYLRCIHFKGTGGFQASVDSTLEKDRRKS
jgi:hypothetical protein